MFTASKDNDDDYLLGVITDAPLQLTVHIPCLSDAEFDHLIDGAELLEKAVYGDKVFSTPDNHIVKLFYRKRWFSSAAIRPYAVRFYNNAKALADKGIVSVHCQKIYRQPNKDRHVIVYTKIPGTILRDAIIDSDDANLALQRMAKYLSELHQSGVYFRSIHFGNVLVLTTGGFALIDITDAFIKSTSLNLIYRARNFRHLLHNKTDRKILSDFGHQKFLDLYLQHSGLSPQKQSVFLRLTKYLAPAWL